MTILLWKFNWPHYDTCGGIKKDAVRLALTQLGTTIGSIIFCRLPRLMTLDMEIVKISMSGE
jgi:hypothetical protein